MSRIGQQPITIPSGVDVSIDGGRVGVKGPRGTLEQAVPHEMTVSVDDGVVTVTRPTDRGPHRSLHGLTRTLVANMVEGVTNGYEKRLEIQGVGYRAALRGSSIELLLGFSHPVVVEPPAGGKLEPEALNDTNRLELCVYANEARRQAVLVARLDNLGKGASGAAVQNLQLMLGLDGAQQQ